MARLFGRKAELIIQTTTPITQAIGKNGGTVVTGHKKTGEALSIVGLRLSFTISKTLKKNPNSAEISVYNLSPKSRAAIDREGLGILLQAGYEGEEAVIFSGLTREVDHTHEGPDWITKIRSGDGTAALNTPIANSFKPGTKVMDVIKNIASSMGVGEGNANDFSGEMSEQYVGGAALHGSASKNMQWALAKAGLVFSIQDGRLQILKPGGSTKEQGYRLSAETGLLGSPEHSVKPKKGKPRILKAKSLLLPQLLPGRRVLMDSRDQKGVFVVNKLTHRGDTNEGDWVSEMELSEVLS